MALSGCWTAHPGTQCEKQKLNPDLNISFRTADREGFQVLGLVLAHALTHVRAYQGMCV